MKLYYVAITVLVAGEHAIPVTANKRSLQMPSIAGYYVPSTDVSHVSNIDRDQDEIERLLAMARRETYAGAKAIYEKGAFSFPTAKLYLDEPLPEILPKDTMVMGMRLDSADSLVGYAVDNYSPGDTTLEILYQGAGCRVGGLTTPDTRGCFAESGTLQTHTLTLNYTYNVHADNYGGVSLQKLSSYAQENYGDFPDFKKFVEYFGRPDYADHWINTAFARGETEFTNGNVDFERYGETGLSESIKKGSVHLSTWMQVVGKMEEALVLCDSGDLLASGSWDQAVAYYVGSLQDAGEARPGNMLFRLADKRCQNFKTCGEESGETSGISKANHDIMLYFRLGQDALDDGLCKEARLQKENISRKMLIAFVQGNLRYAYISDFELDVGDRIEAEREMFAAPVLPLLHACDPEAAAIVFAHSMTGPDRRMVFSELKETYEKNYECLGVTCEDIGGLWIDDISSYLPQASPCKASGASSLSTSAGFWSVFATLAAGTAFMLF